MNRQTLTIDPFKNLFLGFDRLLDDPRLVNQDMKYPPHNLIKDSPTEYRIEMAVAGFNKDSISISVEEGTLKVEGKVEVKEEDDSAKYLYRGLASRSFKKSFNLMDDIEVVDASLVDGILTVYCERIIPDHKQPKLININAG